MKGFFINLSIFGIILIFFSEYRFGFYGVIYKISIVRNMFLLRVRVLCFKEVIIWFNFY